MTSIQLGPCKDGENNKWVLVGTLIKWDGEWCIGKSSFVDKTALTRDTPNGDVEFANAMQ